MNGQRVLKIIVDIAMTAALLLLMAFELVGRQAHEWIGIAMFVLFVVHHILNRKWTGHLLRGKYPPIRILQTLLAVLILICMMSSMVSGIVLSEYVFEAFSIRGGWSWARILHMLAAYWGFVLMSLHLGIHWNMMLGMAGKAPGKRSGKEAARPKACGTWIARLAGVLIAGYGIYAFGKRQIGMYLLLESEFVFFNFEEPRVYFFIDYLAVMGLFIWIGHYAAKLIRKFS